MASKSLYQKQADKRTKTALKLRARFDAKVRKYAAALVTALAGAADAKTRIDRLNGLYNVDISPETLLVHALRAVGLSGTLGTAMSDSTPGEEVQLFNPTADGNGGAVLALQVVFGEVAGTTPTSTPAPTPTAPGYTTTLSGPNEDGQGATLAASAGDKLGFNALAVAGSAPASMTLSWGGAEVASVALLDRYLGQPFSFTHNGTTRRGVFAADVNLS